METVTITANLDELNGLRQLLDRAVRHSGMDAAEAAVYWNNKIVSAIKEHRVPKGNGHDDRPGQERE